MRSFLVAVVASVALVGCVGSGGDRAQFAWTVTAPCEIVADVDALVLDVIGTLPNSAPPYWGSECDPAAVDISNPIGFAIDHAGSIEQARQAPFIDNSPSVIELCEGAYVLRYGNNGAWEQTVVDAVVQGLDCA